MQFVAESPAGCFTKSKREILERTSFPTEILERTSFLLAVGLINVSHALCLWLPGREAPILGRLCRSTP